MYWFVGLGNPGKEYEATRHNIGFMAVDHLAKRWGLSFAVSKHQAMLATGRVAGHAVALLKPQTYMNLSGESIRHFADYRDADLNRLMVIYDDLDTPFGDVRLRYKGSAGGHNGIKSIIAHTGTNEFKRCRIGVGRPAPGRDTVSYVLSPFDREDRDQLATYLERIGDVMEATMVHSFDKVMALYNGPLNKSEG